MFILRLMTLGLVAPVLWLSGCAPAPEGGQAGFDWTIIIFLLLIFGVFYLLIIRPQRRRQKEHQTLMQELQKGDEVITSGGIYGKVESLDEESVVLKIESGATIRIARGNVVGRREK